MRVVLDEKPFETAASNVGEAITAAAESIEDDGRVIVDVIVDGEKWNEQQLGSPDRCGETASEVKLGSANLRELVAQTLHDASEALVVADQMQREAAEDLQADRHSEAMQQLGEALNTWISVQDAVMKSAQALQLDLETIAVEGGTVDESIARLNEQLRSLRTMLQSNDTVALADTLMYELPDVVAQWRETLASIREHVQQAGRDA
jgi:hypothetical protein